MLQASNRHTKLLKIAGETIFLFKFKRFHSYFLLPNLLYAYSITILYSKNAI